MLFVRRIGQMKWRGARPVDSPGRVPADAVTADLRTQENCLPFWTCDEVGDIEEAILAIAAAAPGLDSIDVVWIEDDEHRFAGYGRIRTEGNTPISEWKHRHFDLTALDYTGLGLVASAIVEAIDAERCRRFPRLRVKEMLAEAVSRQKLRLDDLKPKVRSAVETALE